MDRRPFLYLRLLALLLVIPEAVGGDSIAIVAGSCSATIIDSQINVPITITCATPSEDQALKELTKPPLAEQCVFRYPSAWPVINDSANQFSSIIVPPGNELSAYEFEFTFSILQATVWQKLFISVDLLELNDEQKNLLGGVTDAELSRFKAFRAARPGLAIQENDYFKAITPNEKFPDAILTASPLRSAYSLEDGKAFASAALDVYLVDKKLVSTVWVTTYADAYPSLADDVPLYDFRCEANATMPTDTFAKLCISLIEDTTLGPQFGKQECSINDDEGFKAVSPDPGE